MNDAPGLMEIIQSDFEECRPVLTAMGDEVRQLILVALMQDSCSEGLRVGR